MIERINDFMARRFGGVGTSVASFVRIHVWAVAFLVVLSLVVPSHEVNLRNYLTGQVRTTNLALPLNDTRGFAPSPYVKSSFHIAWIAGSEAHLHDKQTGYQHFLPDLALANLPARINGRKIVVDLYFLDAMRLGDIYFTLLDALESHPDMVVIDLNPAWVLNPLATHQWTQLDARAAEQLLTKPRAWPLAAGFLSPSDLLWGVADAHLKEFRDRWYYNDQIHKQVDTLGPLDLRELNSSLDAQTPTRTDALLNSMPLDFWAKYRLHKPRAETSDVWTDWLNQSNKGNNSLPKTIFGLIARTVRSSNVPTLLYVSPVNREWYNHDPAFKDAMSGVEAQLEKLAPELRSPNIVFEPRTATELVKSLKFRKGDLIHLTHADPMGPYLANKICQLAHQVKYHVLCSVSGDEAP